MTGDAAPETKHVATRREHAMAIVRWAMLVGVALLAVYSLVEYGGSDTERARPDRYYCAMHPQVRSPDPGRCPICGMRLVPIPRARAPREASPVPGTVALTLPAARVQLAGVVTVAAARRDVARDARVPAVVEPTEDAVSEVHVRTPAFLERVLVRETSVHVTRGQTLALVYAPAVYAAERELATITRMPAPDARLLEAARQNLALLGVSAADIATVERTGVAARDVALRAPVSGTVTRYDARPGAYATPDAVLYEITDLSRVWAVARLDTGMLSGTTVGAPARFTADGETAEVEGRVDRIETDVDPQTRTARVRVRVENADGRLRPGQSGTISLGGASRSALVVPRDAVLDTGAVRYVLVARGGGEYLPVVVTTGAHVDDVVEIVEGLHEGDLVVARGGFLLDSESRLQAALVGDGGVAPANAHGDAP